LVSDEAKGKVVVITGAGRGIGQESAKAFALLGAKVIIAELSDLGRETEYQINHAGGTAMFIPTDVSDANSVQRLAEQTHSAFGSVDILINNAIRIGVSPVVDMPNDLWDGIVAVNLRGTFLTCKAFLPEMLARNSGVIVNMTSLDALPGLSAYIATKLGIQGFTQSLAIEVGQAGVKVIPFGPGMVDTPGIRGVADRLAPMLGMTSEQFLKISVHQAYDGMMPPEHAAAALVYLVLRLASAYHGEPVTGYDVLEKAGFLKPTMVDIPVEKPVQPDLSMRNQDIFILAEQVQGIVAETAKEFEKLPVFIRPMARGGFKKKAGASLDEWQSLLKSVNAENLEPFRHSLPARLDNLIVYYRGVPAETGRFTKDTAFLEEVARVTAERISVIQKLVTALMSYRHDIPFMH
jgi:NAD(P)-dependent dehydrogenase (short-subunit alcohol dehydrogenase family)